MTNNTWTDLDEAYDFIGWELTPQEKYDLVYATDDKRLAWLENLDDDDKPNSKAFLQALNEMEELESV